MLWGMSKRINITPLSLADAMADASMPAKILARMMTPEAPELSATRISRWRQPDSHLGQRPTPEQFDRLCVALRLGKNDRRRLARWFEDRYQRAVSA